MFADDLLQLIADVAQLQRWRLYTATFGDEEDGVKKHFPFNVLTTEEDDVPFLYGSLEDAKAQAEARLLEHSYQPGETEEICCWEIIRYVENMAQNPEAAYAVFCGREPCSNCSDGCMAEKFCPGCSQRLCQECVAEHETDAPCHDS